MSTSGRTGRRRAVWTVVLSLLIGVSGSLPASAAIQPTDAPAAAQPAPPPLPPPTADTPPTTTPPPCPGEDCLPQPTPAPPLATGTTAGQPDETGSERADCGITNIGGCVTNAIITFFRDLVIAALNPLLDRGCCTWRSRGARDPLMLGLVRLPGPARRRRPPPARSSARQRRVRSGRGGCSG
jgi:hypothetical protein